MIERYTSSTPIQHLRTCKTQTQQPKPRPKCPDQSRGHWETLKQKQTSFQFTRQRKQRTLFFSFSMLIKYQSKPGHRPLPLSDAASSTSDHPPTPSSTQPSATVQDAPTRVHLAAPQRTTSGPLGFDGARSGECRWGG